MSGVVAPEAPAAQDRVTGRSPVQLVLVNAGKLLRGSALGSFLTLLTTLVAARALDSRAFGVLALAQTYALTVEALANVQSSHALIRFGVDAVERGERGELASVVRASALLDAITAGIGASVALLGIGVAAVAGGWSGDAVVVAAVFAVAIMPSVTDAPTGVLRIFDRFDLLGRHAALLGAARLAAVGAVVLADGGLVAIALAWVVADTLGNLLLIGWGVAEVRRQGLLALAIGARPLEPALRRSFRSFAATTHLHSSVRTVTKAGDVLLVGAVGGASVAGVYRLAKQLASVPAHLTDPVYHAVYPALSRLWARRDRPAFRRMIGRVAAGGAAVGAAFVVGFAVVGRWVLDRLLGEEFGAVYATAALLLVGVAIALAGLALHPAMLAMGRAQESFAVLAGATVLHVAALVGLTATFGAVGAGAAYVVFYGIWIVAQACMVASGSQRLGRTGAGT